MTVATWADILSTVRTIAESALQISTVVVGGLAAYYAYKSKAIGDQNSGHLMRQDGSIHAIAGQVRAIAAAAPAPLDPLRAQVEGLADQLESIRNEPGPGA